MVIKQYQAFAAELVSHPSPKIIEPEFTYFLLNDPVADAMDAPHPWRFIVQPCDEGEVFPF